MELIKELLDLTEKVFDEAHYTWFEVTNPITLPRRGKMERIAKGDTLGVRRATSSEGKMRLVTKSRGPSIIWSIDQDQFDDVKKNTKPLRGAL